MVTNNPRRPILRGPYDLLVVGGGINGAGIARDATLRGKSVALVEKGDFAAATSSASSKMVHGGIRYLEHFRVGLVYEALRERSWLLRAAPHLVKAQSFLIPTYEDSRRGPFWIRLGLFLYDLLALGRRLGKSAFLDPSASSLRSPELATENLAGCGVYWDCVMNDARLCLLNLLDATEQARRAGLPVAFRNYTELVELRAGAPVLATVRDRLTGDETQIEAHHVVRAVGPWADDDLLVRSKGVHLVLPPMPSDDGVLLTHSRDGRVFFLIPWCGRTVVGTTETPVEGELDDLRVEPEEVAYLLEELRKVFPKWEVSGKDILGTFAGVRPLARQVNRWGGSRLGAVSRSHRLHETASGVTTVVGGKYTTYRVIAKDVVSKLFPESRCVTQRTPFAAVEAGDWEAARDRLDDVVAAVGVATAERLYGQYGVEARQVAELMVESPPLARPLTDEAPETHAEVVHAIRQEFVAYPEDFLRRRTMLRFSPGGGRQAYDVVEALIREHADALPPDLDERRQSYFEDLAWEDELRKL